jgi:hypothetical protein
MNFGEHAGLMIPRRSQRWQVKEYTITGARDSTNPYNIQLVSHQPFIPAHVTAVRVTATASSQAVGYFAPFSVMYNGPACVGCVLPLSGGDRLCINGSATSLIIAVVPPAADGNFDPTVANARYAINLTNGIYAYAQGSIVATAASSTTAVVGAVNLTAPAFNGTLHGSGQVTSTGQMTSTANGQFLFSSTVAPSHLFGYDSNAGVSATYYRGYPGQAPMQTTSYGDFNSAYVKLEWLE